MEFCSKCSSILVSEKVKEKSILICKSCGYKKTGETKIVEKPKQIKEIKATEEIKDTLPKAKTECPKCGNREAYYRTEQTRAPDEPETIFFTCTKCSKIWREYQ